MCGERGPTASWVMRARTLRIEEAPGATGAVVVVDVVRAFTAAACALAAGASELVLVETVEEAFRLRDALPGSLLMGEAMGKPIRGFDLGNSPAEVSSVDLAGRRLIHRTSNGTRGIARCVHAAPLLAGTFVCAGATARWLSERGLESPQLVITGIYPGSDGDEDLAFADYLDALLAADGPVTAEPFLHRVRDCVHGSRMLESEDPELREDLRLCMDLDRFPFALPVSRKEGLLVLSAELPAGPEPAPPGREAGRGGRPRLP